MTRQHRSSRLHERRGHDKTKFRQIALVGVVSLTALGLIGAGAQAVFTTSTTSHQTITVGTWGAPPTVVITYPVNNTTYGNDWSNTITGTASSNSGAGTTISAVTVAIEDTSNSQWWNGVGFASSTETFNEANNTTSWSLPLGGSSLTSGVGYKVMAKATDSVGYVGTSSTVSFTYNTTVPSVAITYPVNSTTYGSNWGGSITGSAATNASGATITKVKVSVQQVGGLCWTGSGDTYTASCPNYLAVTTGTTSWSLSLSKSDLTVGDSYKVTAQATDSYGDVGTSSAVSFTYATAPPTVTITYPSSGTNVCACNYSGKITGTASSNAGVGTSISSVSVAIENTTTSKWWSGASFSDSSQYFVKASGTASWNLALAGSKLVTGDSYSIVAEATDSLGNVGTSSTVTFTYCLKTSPPTVTITYPVDGTTYGTNWTGTITGTAAAGTGASVKAVSVAIEDTTTNKWWNGTSASFTASKTFVSATGTTTWMLSMTASLTSGNSYAVIAEATDNLGNTGTSSTVDFSYLVKTTIPTVTITYPVNGTTYGTNWSGTITGTAAAGAGASISKTLVSLEDTTTKLWWNGWKFAASTQAWVPVTGTTTWLLSFSGTLTSGDSYAVAAEATDNLSNTGNSSTVTFTYTTPPPTVTITYPVTATAYGTNWAGKITGTASSNSGSSTTITGVSVAVENTTTGKWLVGTLFTGTSQSFQTAIGTKSWSFALLEKYLVSGDAYSIVAEATDSVDNLGTSSTVSFTFDSGSDG